MATEVGLRELLEAGVHFGHQTRRWNPRMRRYIHGERDSIHVIDLLQTEVLLKKAQDFVQEVAAKGGTILFVGTKKQAQDSIEEWAGKCEMPYVNKRWLGGLLTNFNTIKARIKRLHELRGLQEGGQLDLLPTKERMSMEAELKKLEFNLGGVADLQRLPDAIVMIDLNVEEIGLREASRLDIPIVALVDTNCDPTTVDYVVPGNDDAIRSCSLFVGALGSAIDEAAAAWRIAEEKRRAEEAKRKAEEDAKRKAEEEERKKQEAEAAAKEKAEAAQKAKEADEAKKAGAQAQAEAAKQPKPVPQAKQAPKPAAQEQKPAEPAPHPQKISDDAEAPAEPEAPKQHPQKISDDAEAPAEETPAPEPTEAK
jgi:small subunit ribosomal protein S2